MKSRIEAALPSVPSPDSAPLRPALGATAPRCKLCGEADSPVCFVNGACRGQAGGPGDRHGAEGLQTSLLVYTGQPAAPWGQLKPGNEGPLQPDPPISQEKPETSIISSYFKVSVLFQERVAWGSSGYLFRTLAGPLSF